MAASGLEGYHGEILRRLGRDVDGGPVGLRPGGCRGHRDAQQCNDPDLSHGHPPATGSPTLAAALRHGLEQ